MSDPMPVWTATKMWPNSIQTARMPLNWPLWCPAPPLAAVKPVTDLAAATLTPDAGMGTVNYDGTTWRYVPGVVAQVTKTIQAEAMYEGIRFKDVAATYRRHEFAEQRWDNYIHDLYGLSVTGRF